MPHTTLEKFQLPALTKADVGLSNVSNIAQAPAEAYNIKDFGAIGDGVADDTPAFLAVFAEINSINGKYDTIYLPRGNYRITSQINIPIAGVRRIFGEMKSTDYRNFSDSNITLPNITIDSNTGNIFNIVGTEKFIMENIRFNGNLNNPVTPNRNILYIENTVEPVYIKNCHFTGSSGYSAVYISENTKVCIEHCAFDTSHIRSIWNGAGELECRESSFTGYGIEINDLARDNIIKNNILTDMAFTTAAISVLATGDTISRINVIDGNIIRNISQGAGIIISGAQNIIQNNVIVECGRGGIASHTLYALSESKIHNNYLKSTTNNSTNFWSDISISDGNKNSITNNIIFGTNNAYAIDLGTISNNNSELGNNYIGGAANVPIRWNNQTLSPTGSTQTVSLFGRERINFNLSGATTNVTLTINGAETNKTYKFVITHHASTPRNLVMPVGSTVVNAAGTNTGVDIVGETNKTTIAEVFYDGTKFYVHHINSF